jgi:predicted O-linked N-acetylglucosamine transferase (SPINDLY family)
VYNADKFAWKKMLETRLIASVIANNDNNNKNDAGAEAAAQRIIFIPTLSHSAFIQLFQASVTLIDPAPFGGGVTSLEAFAVCKAVVTYPAGQTVPQLTAGMIRKMNDTKLSEALIGSTLDETLEKVLRLGNDEGHRRDVEKRLCEKNGVLYDSKEVVFEWETLLNKVS